MQQVSDLVVVDGVSGRILGALKEVVVRAIGTNLLVTVDLYGEDGSVVNANLIYWDQNIIKVAIIPSPEETENA